MKVFRYGAILLLQLPGLLAAQSKTDFYVSNSGNDSFPGTSNIFPKKTIAGVAPSLKKSFHANGFVKLGLKSGDIFQEGLITSYPIEINTYADNTAPKALAILNGTKEFGSGWLKDSGTASTFYQPIPYTGFVGYGIGAIGEYSFISVFEIDREQEKTAPFSARRLLTFVPNATVVENTAGAGLRRSQWPGDDDDLRGTAARSQCGRTDGPDGGAPDRPGGRARSDRPARGWFPGARDACTANCIDSGSGFYYLGL